MNTEEAKSNPDDNAPLYGLVLAGGKSQRMGTDKGSLVYHEKSQREHLFGLLQLVCPTVYISASKAQAAAENFALPVLVDAEDEQGPIGGMLTAFAQHPDVAWLVVACDLPLLTSATLEHLAQHRNPARVATAYFDPEGIYPEPLIAIWESASRRLLQAAIANGKRCPRKILINEDVQMLTAPRPIELTNANAPADYEQALAILNTDAAA